MSFITAKELNQIFYTEGAFYQRELKGEHYTCRSLAKITRYDTETNHADAVFVMVNPGSCQPLDKNYSFPRNTEDLREIPFVYAKSDPTQYQIMRLMERRKWSLIYIVNLSDLRAGNIDDFRKQMVQFESQYDDSHSVFSKNRFSEVESLLEKDTVVFIGWGTQRFMKDKMQHALNVLSDICDIHGLPHPNNPYYYHPNPRPQHNSIKWLDDICEQLEEKV